MKICVFVFAFIIPVLIIVVCYTLMILRLKSVRLLSGSREKDRNLRRITRLVLVVVAVFIICWTPIHIFVLVEALGDVSHSTAAISSYYFCIALGYTNSSLNPILYAFLDENFKRCFKDFCFPFKMTRDRQSTTRVRNTIRDSAYAGQVDGTDKPVWLVVEMSSYCPTGREESNDIGITQITTAVWNGQLDLQFLILCKNSHNINGPFLIKRVSSVVLTGDQFLDRIQSLYIAKYLIWQKMKRMMLCLWLSKICFFLIAPFCYNLDSIQELKCGFLWLQKTN